MGTHLYTYDDPPAERDLRRALQALENDGVIAYPNDLNWAFGCDAASPKALDRIHLLKPTHPKDVPFSLLCSSISMAAEYVVIDNAAYRLLKRAWPGPYTVLLQATRTFPRQLKDKRRIVGIRIPASVMVRTLVERLARPLATTSVPGEARFGYEVFEAYGHAVDLVLDLGTELPGSESTIVDLTDGVPAIIRRGAGDPALFEETSA
jgi:tRNA threonylcarbamoyl adenosine modification protein (Sua5/YciO/YrdC/YwlC family)